MLILLFLILITSASNQSDVKFEQFCPRKANQQLQGLIERIIEEIKEPIQCIVYIGDFYYREAVKFFDLKISHKFPIYQLRIGDSQKLFPPRNRVLSILKSSRKSACNLYLILMANGMQLSKLLQFVEENRLVDTRAMFIMMNDFRLLQPNMQYLWNRILNVIFIRRYNVFKRRSGEQVIREWYDLNTIYYPATVKGLVVTKYVDSWNRGRFRYNTDHFPQKMQNLHRKHLRVAVFQHVPAVTEIAINFFKTPFEKTSHALGLEFELMRIIAESVNFRPLFYEPANVKNEKWGKIGENETTGLLGEAVNRKAAFYLGDLHYTSRHLNIVDLAWPYNIECLTFLTPESLTENSWKLLIQPFDLLSWIFVIVTLIIAGIVMFLFALLYERQVLFWKFGVENIEQAKKLLGTVVNPKNKRKNKLKEEFKDETEGLYLFSEPTNSMLYTYSMLLQVSLPMLPRAFAVRILIGWWWIYAILITCSYRASLTAALANPTLRVTIDTVDELAKSLMSVSSWGEEKKDYFLSSGDENLQIIGSRFEEISDEHEAVDRVANGKMSYYENIFALQQIRVKRQILEYELKRNGTEQNANIAEERNLHVMEECVVNMPVSLGLDKNSPLKPRVDQLVKRTMEVGLLEKWLKDAMEWSKIAEMKQENESEKAIANLRKLQGALVALAVGYFFGFLALFAEILHWRYIVTKNPLFDKYHLDSFYHGKSNIFS